MPFLSLLSILLFGLLSRSQLVITQLLNDQTTLVEIGKELKISGWNVNNSDYCTWPGVSCSSKNSSVERLDLSSHGLQGNLTLISELKSLKWLDLSFNNFHDIIPSAFGNLSELEFLDLSFNDFGGSIPLELARLRNLRALNLSNNLLMGVIPDELEGKLDYSLSFSCLNLHSNQLEGSIPESIFTMEKLETLVLTQNRLTGYIPDSIGKCKGLSSIRIGNNKLIGGIPREIGNISSLTYFEANNNNLSGEIVTEFSRCSNLTLLNLASNGFTGTVPLEFGLLSNLQELIVSGNSLFGDIPISILRSKTLNKLDLKFNKRGDPARDWELHETAGIATGSNYLTGSIPPEIGHIKNLQIALNLSSNHLRGHLPEELGRLDKLVSLDVSNNQLSGSIPSALKGMLSLIEVNFSNNHFTGPIPSFIPFQKSLNSSFLGNKGLCGEPLSISCEGLDDSSHDAYHHKVSYRIILAVIGSGLAVFASVTVVVLLFMMRERQEKAAKDAGITENDTRDDPVILAGNVFVENLRQAIDFEAVAKATLKDSNKLSIGTFSTVYRADMPSGMSLSVRKLKSMDRTILNHQSKMIREYFPNGTLYQFLHDSTKKPDYKPDWPTRLAIAIGVAEGLTFLHHVAIIHLDISSGNVLLDSDFNPLVGEVEISKLLDPSRGTASISAIAGSFGYIPPEYAYTMQVTAPGNVYSYGVVLLEILTTQLPVDEAFGEGIDLVKWVHTAPTRGKTPEQILDARLSTVSFAWRKEMLAALKIALLCTDTTPAKRPKMKKVVEMLQEITQN
ncbi:UNVERIFIED_CONTAM: Leucine-rich repeat receptor-like tyrosine-protein kinase PXC3 [Sesamum latifolium]|uniref:Leucine-rich repeat receptor-like tyrosine-protein kinase PXC3 n=1 Tax=Sesamum latifolium TaxID=2727402 RepID=A0AAW2VHY6_9LAMI